MADDKSSGLWFIGKTIATYILWMLVRKSMKSVSFLYPIWVAINDWLAAIYIKLSVGILQPIMSETLKFNQRNIIIKNTEGLYVGDHCLGISAMFIFTVLIAILKGKPLHKIAYITFGLTVIFLINLFRIVGLALMLKNGSKAFFHFNHSYTYLVLVYGIIFLMIIFWEKRFANKA